MQTKVEMVTFRGAGGAGPAFESVCYEVPCVEQTCGALFLPILSLT